ncbi:MAG: hypothetical protein H8E64_07485 [Candidatus Marinimicrobia bacterium]|nr:hypothetical protein [Candidatus Neomarinimicrobiota bacterium]
MKEFLGFRKMVSTLIIKIIYVLGALTLTVGGIVMPFIDGDLILPGIGALLIGNLLWRVICEAWILLFSIHDILGSIEANTKTQ